jgi:hypothetical protein
MPQTRAPFQLNPGEPMKHPAVKPSIPDLTNWTEGELLEAAAEIFVQDGPLDARRLAELKAIDEEFERRDSLLLGNH